MNGRTRSLRTTISLLSLGLLMAWASGSTRSCEPIPEEPLECFSDFECPPEKYCEKPMGACRGAGLCATPPEACITLWDPVCGCDGNTYGNACEAAAARVNVESKGPCDQVAFPCRENLDCARIDFGGDEYDSSSLYCAKDPGDCDGEGACEPRPTACPRIWDPVCGCDGTTYSNDCVAASEGVNVDYRGACDETYCWNNDMCAKSEYCFFEHCGLESGVCKPRPENCPDVYEPVCGCDEVTYSNACEAAKAGMSVDHKGECRTDGHCWSHDDCARGEYCLFDGCAAETGRCVKRPNSEDCPRLWAPVCGCDGVTYPNRCRAAVAGQSIDYEGECEPIQCWGNHTCPDSHYCLYSSCGMRSGYCAPRPEGCPDVYEPVCGCDGVTYSNACDAAAAGQTVDYEGECRMKQCWGNDYCPPKEYCLYSSCNMRSGYCVARPDACPDIYKPVCGCDGETYSNACYAAAAGQTVDYAGQCRKLTD